jgi:hypothetical protein
MAESRTVTGARLAPDQVTPAVGQLRFVPSTTVYDGGGNTVLVPTPLFVTLDSGGHYTIDLVCTDDPGTNPVGWTWIVSELFAGGREFQIQVPTAVSDPVDDTSLVPAVDVDETWQYATSAEVAAALATVATTNGDLNDRMDLIDLDSAVVTAAVVIHPFLTMGA